MKFSGISLLVRFFELNKDINPYKSVCLFLGLRLIPILAEVRKYYSEALSLPLYYDLTEEDVDRVVSTLVQILKGKI